MATTGASNQRKKNNSSPSLSEIAHKEAMDYYRLAEKSQYPEIRAAALKEAERASKHQRRQTSRLSPMLVALLAVSITAVAGAACWYCFLHDTQAVAFELSAIVLLLYVAIIAVLLFLAARLTEGSLMKALGWIPEHVKEWWVSRKKTPDNSLPS